MADEYDVGFKVVFLGDSGTGKSALLKSDSSSSDHGAFEHSQAVSLKVKLFDIDGKVFRVELWDCPGAERHIRLASRFVAGAAAVVLVFSVVDRDSFESVEEWRVEAERGGGGAFVLAGTFADAPASARQVPRADAEAYAASHGMPYLEVCATRGGGGDVVQAAVSAVRERLPSPLDPAAMLHSGVHLGARLARDPDFQASLYSGAVDRATRVAAKQRAAQRAQAEADDSDTAPQRAGPRGKPGRARAGGARQRKPAQQ